MMQGYCVISVTYPRKEIADEVTNALMDQHLIAVGQGRFIDSIYEWEGKRHNDKEYYVEYKTSLRCANEVTRIVRAMHPYEVPEILVTPSLGGLPDYLNWIDNHTEGV